jgi:hypothetical protein
MSELCGKLMEAMKSFDEVEWGKYGPAIDDGETDPYPPVTVWRYKEKDERRDQLIVDAVESFNGSIQWKISFRDREILPGRNWYISPKKYEDFINDPTVNYGRDTKAEFAKLHPEIGEMANKELPKLAEHIKNTVQARLTTNQRQA